MKKISEVSQIVGVSKRTLQYYDEEGILPTERTSSNHRIYSQHTLEQIWQILVCKEMGFELEEIKYLINLPPNQKERYFVRQIERIEKKITTMKGQLKFISLVRSSGFPEKLGEYCGKTYMMYIEEMKEKMKE